MNVYDFDKTVINADSTVLFLEYCAARYPRLFKMKPGRKLSAALAYLSGRETPERMKEELFSFLPYIADIGALVSDFWDRNECRVEPWYREVSRSDDLIISASPAFIVRGLADRLGGSLIATEMSETSGRISGVNCRGEEKLRRFRLEYPGCGIDRFYSDSLSDAPLASEAKEAFLIRKHEPVPWPEQ